MKGNIFIKRPVMAISIAIMILLVGAISYFSLPVETYPDIAPPTVSVSATYTGASATAVMNAVIQPLEEQINGVENMLYMTSTATNSGSASITIYFKQGTNADMAAVNVQNRVSQAQGLLPAEVTKIGVTTRKRQTSFLQIDALACTNGVYDEDFIANYLDINVIPQIKRVEGVGDVMELGGTYSLRIWMKPDIMATYSVVPSDITAALAEQNLESPAGQLGEKPVNGTHGEGVDNVLQYTMKYTGRLQEISEFEDIVIRANADGTTLRLKDIADIELGAQSYAFHGEMNGQPGVTFLCYQLAGSNAKETNDRVTAKLEELSKDLPEGLEFVQMMSSNDFLLASIANVEETLIIAIILVIFVVYFFLQDFRATVIPSISIIVSLVGTFACLSLAGFTLNLLTLFALVLAIGTVVDDAIVVVEAVQAKFDAGYKSPYEATKDAMADVTMAVISCTFVFMAVFIPVSFMGGTSGVFYTQFGVTLATAVGLSCVSALVLCPALCAMMMKPASDEERHGFWGSINHRTRKAYQATYEALSAKYTNVIHRFVQRKWRYIVSFGALVVAVIGMMFFASDLPKGLVPQEDQGTLMMNVSGVPGNNVASTYEVLNRAEEIIKDIPEVKAYNKVAGYGFIAGQGTSYGMMIVKLKPWGERAYGILHPIDNFLSTSTMVANAKLNLKLLSEISDAQCFVFEPGMIPGYGMGSIELQLQDKTGAADKEVFFEYTQEFIAKLSERPEVARAITTYARNFPQLQVEVDAAQCKKAGISPATVLSELGAYCGGSYVSNMNQFSKIYRVMLEAAPEYRMSEDDLSNLYIRNGNEMAPISQFVKLTKIEGPEVDNRFNLFSSIGINISPATGVSNTDVMLAVAEVAKDVFPDGYAYEYGGMAREEAETIGSMDTYIIYGVCVVLIFLILSCLYESFLVPFAVIFSVPAGLMGTYLFAWLWNQGYAVLPFLFMGQIENNIYLQTGVIMLIGLLAKTAILITEFALERRRKGMGIVEAAYAAAEARLRPIMMTVLTMIFGMIPLVFASGAGSNGNRTIGIGVIGGMTVGTIAILFTVPLFFIIFQFLQEKIRPVMKVEADQQFMKEREKSQKAKEAHTGGKTTIVVLALLASTLGLSSCGTLTTYKGTEVSTEEIYGDATIGDTLGLGDLPWRQVFTDPVLQGLISKTLEQNTNMLNADLRLQEVEYSLRAAKLAFVPSIYFAPSGTVSKLYDPYSRDKYTAYTQGNSKTYELPVSAGWQSANFLQLRNQKKGAEVKREQMKWVKQAVQAQLVVSVASLYYNLAMLDEQLAMMELYRDNWATYLDMERKLMDAGRANTAAVASIEATYWSICTSVVSLKDNITILEANLSTLMGESAHGIERQGLATFQAPQRLNTGLPLRLLSRRPDVRQAELTLASAFYDVNAARSAFWPSISISATGEYTNSVGTSIINPGMLIGAAVASLTQPIFANGRLRAQLKVSKLEMEAAENEFRQAVVAAGNEVQTALVELHSAQELGGLLAQQVKSLSTALDATQKLYAFSSTNYLNVITAQNSLIAAQMDFISNRMDAVSAVIALYQALGGGGTD